MKRLIVVLMLLCPLMAMGQTKAVTREFPLKVHVFSSRIQLVPGDTNASVRAVNLLDLLLVTAEGKKYVLAVPLKRGIFARMDPVLIEPGDYPARIIKNETPNPGEMMRTYELRLANGKTVKALLWGMSE